MRAFVVYAGTRHCNHDGSLDLYLQRDDPGGAKHINWLPAPASGGFSMMMRLYWPEKRAIEGGWSPPPVVRLPMVR